MAYASNILRLVVSGSLYETEAFSWSLSFMPNFSETPVVPEEVPAAVQTAVTTYHTSGVVSAPARLETIKLNLIGPDGRYVDQGNTVLFDYPGTGIPGTASVYPAPQVALAVTTRTAAQRGRAHAGRFYSPVPPYNPGTNGQISVSNAEAAVTAATALCNALNTALAPDWVLGVVSEVGTGTSRQITHVSVGRVLDTIRSRRTSIVEAPVMGDPLT